MNVRKILSVLLILTTTSTLFAKPASLKGKVINNNKYKEIHLQDISFKNIETKTLNEDGSFSFDKKFNEFDYYLVVLDEKNYTVFFPEPGEQTEMTIDIKNMTGPVIKNSLHSNIYYKYSSLFGKLKQDSEKIDLIKKMVDENPNSPTCLLFVNILDTKKYYSYHEKLSKGLEKYENNALIKDFIKQTKNIKKLEVGSIAPDIDLNNPDGKSVKLSSLRGNYVLIDFWASWCGPCRMENPNVVKLYDKYNSKGFEIYGVSLDRSKDAWTKAIEKDKLAWTHVSDLKFWQSEGAKIYNVSSIPHTVLLDKEGRIIAKDLRGASLENKLEEIFAE